MEKQEIKIKVVFTYYRNNFDKDPVNNWVILSCENSKSSVLNSIRNYAKSWNGRGFLMVIDVYNTTGPALECCNIKQTKFSFNN